MNLIEFYTKVANSFGLEIKHNQVYAGSKPMTIKSKGVLLPTEENYKRVLVNGEVKYLIFNILKEDRIKDVDPVVQRLLRIMEVTHNLMLKALVMGILYEIANNNKTVGMDLYDLLIGLENAKGSAKVLIDDKTLDSFNKMLDSNSMIAIKYFLRHGIKHKGEKFYSGIVLKPVVLDSIDDLVDEYKLRNKDRRVLEIIYTYLINDIYPDTVIETSSHEKFPDALVLLKSNLDLYNTFEKYAGIIEGNPYFENMFDVCYSYDDLIDADGLYQDALGVPDIMDISHDSRPKARVSIPDNEVKAKEGTEYINPVMKAEMQQTQQYSAPITANPVFAPPQQQSPYQQYGNQYQPPQQYSQPYGQSPYQQYGNQYQSPYQPPQQYDQPYGQSPYQQPQQYGNQYQPVQQETYEDKRPY